MCIDCKKPKEKAPGSGRARRCRECHRTKQRVWYQNNKDKHKARASRRRESYLQKAREILFRALGTGCVDCGERDVIVLQFDHVSGDKLGNVCEMVHQMRPIHLVKEEIKKCEVRCANCHVRATAQRHGGWWKSQASVV